MALLAGQIRSNGVARDADGRQLVVAYPPADLGQGTLLSDTLIAGASSTTAPGATTTVSNNAAGVSGGIYRLDITINLSGTAETQLANLRLRSNGSNIATLASLPGSNRYQVERVTSLGGNFDIQTISAATAGAIYTVFFTATRIA